MADEKKETKREEAQKEEIEREPTPYSLTHHPDGKPRKLIIGRPGGSGQREITVEQWDATYSKAPIGTWEVYETEVVAPHHSDGAY